MSRGPVVPSWVSQPPTRAFIDDMTITAKSVLEGKWMLQDLVELINLAKCKPSKSRSLKLKKGKVQDRKIRIGGEIVPTITERQVKKLVKWFIDSLKDIVHVDEMVSQTEKWMTIIDKSGLPGKYKDMVLSAWNNTKNQLGSVDERSISD
ncbi:uncharacterized protein LOC134713974 [Mytilus trossulus]|uniref:uncharacterized protein LOC134713974 n=1 Tax=Mytilus trossulus TaxID=6551 RepID=UPI0030054872